MGVTLNEIADRKMCLHAAGAMFQPSVCALLVVHTELGLLLHVGLKIVFMAMRRNQHLKTLRAAGRLRCTWDLPCVGHSVPIPAPTSAC